MNAPAPKFMIESAWHGRIFTTGWTPANGGGLDVPEPVTGLPVNKFRLSTKFTP
jgi:hypothetical protein